MPRQLKTFVTSIGFYDLAVAAPSMKAALEAWGVTRNLFHSNLAHETSDPNIVAAAMAQPGVVLRRGVGTKDSFSEHAKLPKNLPANAPERAPMPRAKPKTKTVKGTKPAAPASEKAQKAAVIEFAKAKARRDAQREKEEAERVKQEAAEEREEERRQKAVEKAEAIRDRARERHEEAIRKLEAERDEIDQSIEDEHSRWAEEEKTLDGESVTRPSDLCATRRFGAPELPLQLFYARAVPCIPEARNGGRTSGQDS